MLVKMVTGGGGGSVNPTVIADKRTINTYSDNITIESNKTYVVLTYWFTSDYTVHDYNLYKLVNGTLTLTDSHATQQYAPVATISGTTLNIAYSYITYNNGYFVIEL